MQNSSKRGLRTSVLASIAVIIVVVAGILAYYQFGATPQVKTETISIDIKAIMENGVEKHVFDPATITVHKGSHVVLIVTNVDELPHGIEITQLGLDTGSLRENQSAKLEFDAQSTGTFTMECSVPGCAPDHAEMLGQLVVVA